MDRREPRSDATIEHPASKDLSGLSLATDDRDMEPRRGRRREAARSAARPIRSLRPTGEHLNEETSAREPSLLPLARLLGAFGGRDRTEDSPTELVLRLSGACRARPWDGSLTRTLTFLHRGGSPVQGGEPTWGREWMFS